MKILIVGASRFIGSHLIDRLLINNNLEKIFCTFFSNNYSSQYKNNKLIFQKCDDKWCKIKTEQFLGWVKIDNIWGSFN